MRSLTNPLPSFASEVFRCFFSRIYSCDLERFIFLILYDCKDLWTVAFEGHMKTCKNSITAKIRHQPSTRFLWRSATNQINVNVHDRKGKIRVFFSPLFALFFPSIKRIFITPFTSKNNFHLVFEPHVHSAPSLYTPEKRKTLITAGRKTFNNRQYTSLNYSPPLTTPNPSGWSRATLCPTCLHTGAAKGLPKVRGWNRSLLV